MSLLHLHQRAISRMSCYILSKAYIPARSLNHKVFKHSFSSSSRLPILTLYTKHPCPLCDDAKEALYPFKHLFTLEEVDITESTNKEWFQKYCYDIPVFHFEGKFLMKHRVDFDALKIALNDYKNSNAV